MLFLVLILYMQIELYSLGQIYESHGRACVKLPKAQFTTIWQKWHALLRVVQQKPWQKLSSAVQRPKLEWLAYIVAEQTDKKKCDRGVEHRDTAGQRPRVKSNISTARSSDIQQTLNFAFGLRMYSSIYTRTSCGLICSQAWVIFSCIMCTLRFNAMRCMACSLAVSKPNQNSHFSIYRTSGWKCRWTLAAIIARNGLLFS